jgi:integrase
LDGSRLGLIQDLAERYFQEYCQTRNRDIKTKRYRLDLIKDRLGLIPVAELLPSDVDSYIRWRKSHSLNKRLSEVSNATVNKDLAILKHMMHWAVQRRILLDNPIRDYEKLPEQRIERSKPTEAIVNAVFAKIDPLVLPVFLFIRETGCRRGEALALTHDRVRIEDRKAVINIDKEGKPKFLFLTDNAVEAIQSMPVACEFVFYNPKTLGRWYDCKKYWESARKEAGYTWLQIKDLRRAYGIKLAESGGVEMHHIQKALGHSSVKVTEEYYAHFSPDSSQERVLRVLEGGRK